MGISRGRKTPIVLAMLILVALVSSGLSGCSLFTTSNTVPILWAGTSTAGEEVGGVEQATVVVDPNGSGGFTLDLESEIAKGAGPVWQATSAMAATIATLVSGTDPSSVDIEFGVTGPIDGPSGGAMLTVGVLAGLRQLDLDPTVTMTGTISPDGAVGRVSGIATKLRAAADAGFTRVLLPQGNRMIVAPGSSVEVDAADYGAEVGVKVEFVNDIGQAFAAFTGGPIAPAVQGQAQLSEPVASLAITQTQAMIGRLEQLVGIAEVSDVELGAAAQQLSIAQAALARGDSATGYGVASAALLRLVAEQGRAQARSQEAAGNLTSYVAELRATVSSAQKATRERLRADAAQTQSSVSSQVALPFAMGWLTYADAALGGIDTVLLGSPTSADVIIAAGSTAAHVAGTEVMYPDALAMAQATSGGGPAEDRDTVGFLSGYTNFLIRAADANAEYYLAELDAVSGARPGLSGPLGVLRPAMASIATTVEVFDPNPQTVTEEVAQSAYAITYFVLSSEVIISAEVGMPVGGGLSGADLSGGRLQLALDNAAATVNDWAVGLEQSSDLRAEYPVWSVAWGTAAARELQDSADAAGALEVGLGEAWYAAMNTFMLGGLAANSTPG